KGRNAMPQRLRPRRSDGSAAAWLCMAGTTIAAIRRHRRTHDRNEPMQNTLFPAVLAASLCAAALVLPGCASQAVLVPQVQQEVADDGAKTVRVAPERLECQGGPRCPRLAAAWTSAKAGQAQLVVGLPDARAEITGVDVHVGGSGTVRLRLRSTTPADAPAQPGLSMSSFD